MKIISKLNSVLFFTFLFISVSAQDTITYMQYNLLNYGNYVYGCTETTNGVDQKNEYLKTIIDYVKPDILCVNEIVPDKSYQDYLLNNVFVNYSYPEFKRAETTGDYLANQVYYNSDLFTLYNQRQINISPRIADVYTFYFNSDSLQYGDTVFFNVIVAHLKAGNDQDDASQRADAADKIMQWLLDNSLINVVFSGDFNLYTSSEAAFQTLTNYTQDFGFIDAANRVGNWHANSDFADVHSQSTQTEDNHCATPGGMDDRFDFILILNDIKEGKYGIKYVDESYKVIGQDGKHFDTNLLAEPENTTVPSDVLNALFKMSDHLPVMAKFAFRQSAPEPDAIQALSYAVRITNPVSEELNIFVPSDMVGSEFVIRDITGKTILKDTIKSEQQGVNFTGMQSGMYFITIKYGDIFITQKIIKP